MRLTDDFMYITTNINKAKEFVKVMHQGIIKLRNTMNSEIYSKVENNLT